MCLARLFEGRSDLPARLRRRTYGVSEDRAKPGVMAVCLLAGVLAAGSWASGAAAPDEAGASTAPTTITTGSGRQYETTVDRKTEGELNPEDFRQASLLSSRLVNHLNRAVEYLADENSDAAGAEVEKAVSLSKIIRDLLPTTVVTTVVKDADGKEVYRHVDRVQDDRIPLYEGMIAVDVIEPVSDAKREAAEIRGIRLADADLLHTSVLVELSYVDRKLQRAAKLLKDKPEDALHQLELAQTEGVTYAVNREDNPLVAVQRALQLAERMVEQECLEAAGENLQLAKNHLELYRGLVSKKESAKVNKLEKDITALQGEIEKKGAAKKIREFWDRVAGWFIKQPSETEKTVEVKEEPKE